MGRKYIHLAIFDRVMGLKMQHEYIGSSTICNGKIEFHVSSERPLSRSYLILLLTGEGPIVSAYERSYVSPRCELKFRMINKNNSVK